MFNSILEKGYFIRYSANPGSIDNPANYFCGEHNVSGADCPNCNKKLLRLFSFDAHEFPVDRLSFPFSTVGLFFCWTCNISQGDFYYKYLDDDEIKILQYEKDGVVTDFPYELYPEYFPESHIEFVEIDENVQQAVSKLNLGVEDEINFDKQMRDLIVPKHQFGGEPYLIQPDEIKKCPECLDEMSFLVAVGDDCLDDRGFTGNDFVQTIFKYCPKCFAFCAYQRCD